MSSHYNVTFNTQLRTDLSPIEVAALDYLFGECDSPPSQFPDHWFFQQEEITATAFWHLNHPVQYSVPGYIYRLWRSFDETNTQLTTCGVNIYLHGIKDSALWSYCELLGLFGWLASLSVDHGLVGSHSVMDSVELIEAQTTTLYLIQDNELFISTGQIGECHSVMNSAKK